MAVYGNKRLEKKGTIRKSYSEIIKRGGAGEQERGINACIQNTILEYEYPN